VKRIPEPNTTYPGEARENTNNDPNTTNLLTKILEEFKAMLQQLTQQST
jgi:hypothetical protein